MLNFLDGRSKSEITSYSIALIIAFGILDSATGNKFQFLLFYLIPIALASWYVGGQAGLVMAILSSVASFVVALLNPPAYSAQWVADWNFIAVTTGFVLFGVSQTQLRTKIQNMTTLASKDCLTGLPNGHAFYQRAALELKRLAGVQPLTLAYVDIAGFQSFNQRHGYTCGDRFISTVAHLIGRHVQRPDLVARVGGTSFAILLPKTGAESALFVLETLHTTLKEEKRKYDPRLIFFISAIACHKAPETLAALLQEADSQMSRMKGSKKDGLEVLTVGSSHALN